MRIIVTKTEARPQPDGQREFNLDAPCGMCFEPDLHALVFFGTQRAALAEAERLDAGLRPCLIDCSCGDGQAKRKDK